MWFNGNDETEVQPRKSVWNLRSRKFRHAWTTFIRNESHMFLPLMLNILPAAKPWILRDSREDFAYPLTRDNDLHSRMYTLAVDASSIILIGAEICLNLLLMEELSELWPKLFRTK
ncbi:hypothetical protein PsorP6_012348 [Peronosclerospora sorghi]|uniref:Uncharacterized protein n=1 Tax=Peronosclerospora sorghi TaxID=230839 RepID=A0ACC0WFM4_9STRA|nr:hypothetical protein PsorP6_012348 [Peronosclerospora sorghi]